MYHECVQVNDQACVMDDDDTPFSEGWRPRLHPANCGCVLRETASPPSARIDSRALTRYCVLLRVVSDFGFRNPSADPSGSTDVPKKVSSRTDPARRGVIKTMQVLV